jgi:hypothetical protein
MNERIRELAEQANIGLFEDKSFGWNVIAGTDQHLEKFAELIVLECMHECLRMQLGNQYTPEELLFQTKYRKIIKEHFGVKNEGFRSVE